MEDTPNGGWLRLQNSHTREVLAIQPFDKKGLAKPEALVAIHHMMRCSRTGRLMPIDQKLIQSLMKISAAYKGKVIQMISGYRNPLGSPTRPTSYHAKGMAIDTAVSQIKGKSGTEVTVKISREGAEPFNVTMKRAEIRIPNIQSRMEGDLGYVRLIHSFDSSAGQDIRAEIKKLKDQGAKGIIFDLRGNPGGLLMSGVDVASAFIEKGVIVSIKERKGAERKYTAIGKADKEIPLVVLVNKGSASASEIVAGAVQDYERGPIIGDQTYGKGSVQSVLDLSDGSGLIITTAKYYTPKGRSISKVGVTPDIKISNPEGEGQPDLQLDKAKEVLQLMLAGTDWRTLKN